MHVLILTGGQLNLSFAKQYCKTLSFDKVFAVDKGLEYADALGFVPDLILGDFDTVDYGLLERYRQGIEKKTLTAAFEEYPVKKDATDTELALIKAIEIQAEQVTILAGTGSRLDHVLMNMNLLLMAEEAGVICYMVDETNRIQLLCGHTRNQVTIGKELQHGKYVSVVPMSPVVEGLTLEGVAYPLHNHKITQGNSLTVSNQIVDTSAHIHLKKGCIWVIESRD